MYSVGETLSHGDVHIAHIVHTEYTYMDNGIRYKYTQDLLSTLIVCPARMIVLIIKNSEQL